MGRHLQSPSHHPLSRLIRRVTWPVADTTLSVAARASVQKLPATDIIVSMAPPRPSKQPTPVPDVMTIDDLSVYLQVSKSSLYKLAQEGRVPGQKVGKHWRFHKDAVDAWLKTHPRT